MRGNCLDREMVYKAEVQTHQGPRHYYGQTARTFKERFYGHTSDLRHREKTNSTALSKFVWKFRDTTGEDPEITWSKLKSARPYSVGSAKCSLCLTEKIAIAQDKSGKMINRRREIMNRCLHKDRYKLSELAIPTITEEDSIDSLNDDNEVEDSSLDVHEDLDVEEAQDDNLTEVSVHEAVPQLPHLPVLVQQHVSLQEHVQDSGGDVYLIQDVDHGNDIQDVRLHEEVGLHEEEEVQQEHQPQQRRSHRIASARRDWRCFQYSDIIERNPP